MACSGLWGEFFQFTHRKGTVAQLLARLKTASEQKHISVKTLRRYIAHGRISAYRLGPKIMMVDLNEINAVLLKRIPNGGRGQ